MTMTKSDWEELRSAVMLLTDQLATGDTCNPSGGKHMRLGLGEMISAALGDGDLFPDSGTGLGARVGELASAVETSGSDIASAIRELAEAVRDRS